MYLQTLLVLLPGQLLSNGQVVVNGTVQGIKLSQEAVTTSASAITHSPFISTYPHGLCLTAAIPHTPSLPLHTAFQLHKSSSPHSIILLSTYQHSLYITAALPEVIHTINTTSSQPPPLLYYPHTFPTSQDRKKKWLIN
ncbi:hypothetical protein E2C01_075224 [Portunus trituberculatus]|uniref:Uncharacterized protein n=1 Tax=Portunus trituberculatus TaxID=210409 RepID=A0A5B7IFM3_PORTR|nr:hypothetical protein [Portunus trituberculatus]